MNPLLPDFEGSKVNACAENVFRIWSETADKRLTQLVFSDFSTPNKDGRFNIYDDIVELPVATCGFGTAFRSHNSSRQPKRRS
jgi:hypothetical protein